MESWLPNLESRLLELENRLLKLESRFLHQLSQSSWEFNLKSRLLHKTVNSYPYEVDFNDPINEKYEQQYTKIPMDDFLTP